MNHQVLRRRAEDQGRLATIRQLYNQYKPIWIVLAGLAVASGFGFKTPAATFSHLQGQIDTLRIDLNGSNQRLKANVESIVKLYCLDQRIPERDKELAGLKCGGDK